MRIVNVETIKKLVDHNKATAYISYIDFNGYPVSKAMMTPRKMDGLKYIYFSTNTSSNKVTSFRTNNKSSVYFVDKRFFRGVSLIGTVEVLTDEETKAMIWQEGDERFYPEGVNDSDYCVLKFTATHGRYYSSGNHDFEIE